MSHDDTIAGMERIEEDFPPDQPITPTRIRRAFLRTWQLTRGLDRRLETIERALQHVVDKELPTYGKHSALAAIRRDLEELKKEHRGIKQKFLGTLGAIVLMLLKWLLDQIHK